MALFDWQGNRLDPEQIPLWDGMTGLELSGGEVARLYATQHGN